MPRFPAGQTLLIDADDTLWENNIYFERAIAALPDGARHVLVLVGIYGFSHAEAASALGVAEGTCKAQLHRARQLLSSNLGLEET